MRKLKSIPEMAIGAALDKALRYRLLNEPLEAESICLDMLAVDPDNQQALVTMLLAITDLFEEEYVDAFHRAKAVLPRLAGQYERAYYEGVIHERWGKAQASRKVPSTAVSGWYLHAMHCFERAEALAPPDNPDAILRYNTCVRMFERIAEVEAPAEQDLKRDVEAEFGEEVQTR
ncbi:MAG TPA: hypothetical protein VMP01_21375 [Pirellulaceae bacterium]|nr:hypothetical protein [Pirellulaceae bacterium]